jgi:KUP system potassium uptake protein
MSAITARNASAADPSSSNAAPAAALAALGILYGDLGTSPLYALQSVIGSAGGHLTPEFALSR